MAFNGPTNGTDWSTVDTSKAPWASGIAELTNDEVVYVKDQCAIIAVGHETDDFYIQSKYNESTNYEKAVNGDTYFCIKGYDPAINTQGINADGIIPEPDPSTTTTTTVAPETTTTTTVVPDATTTTTTVAP